jgi:tetratricopeptide (TPR) repeat protein
MTPAWRRSLHPQPDGSPGMRLESWKEIAAYLKRDESTVQRWEKREGMPVHRHIHHQRGSVFAYVAELDAWRDSRAADGDHGGEPGATSAVDRERASDGDTNGLRGRRLLAGALLAAAAAILAHAPLAWHPPDARPSRQRSDALPLLQRPSAAAAQPHSIDPAARQEYLIARYHLAKYNEHDLSQAIDRFERATRLDPAYAAAHAGLSHAWWARGLFGARTMQQVESACRVAARTAAVLDEGLAETQVALGRIKYTYDHDWAGAERHFARALEVDADNVEAHYFSAMLFMGLGRFDESLAHIQRAEELDPLSSTVQSAYGRVLYRARRFAEAVPRLNRAIELEPRNHTAYSRLADVYEAMGRLPEALATLDEAEAASERWRSNDARRARIHARMGDRSRARRMLLALEARHGDFSLAEAAAAYAALGDSDRAFHYLFRLADTPAPGMRIFIREDPPLSALHSDPRWGTVLQRLNLHRRGS